MARVSTLCDCAVVVLSTVCVDLVGAVVFLVVLALVTSKVGADLCTNTSAVSNLDAGDLVADLDDLANDLVSYAERQRELLSPSSSDGVDIGCADTTGVNGNVDIVLLELLKGKLGKSQYRRKLHNWVFTDLLALESAPVLDVGHREGVGSLRVRHCCDWI
jgi:hypothetical protein